MNKAQWHSWFAWYPVDGKLDSADLTELPASNGYVTWSLDLSKPSFGWTYEVTAWDGRIIQFKEVFDASPQEK